MTLSALLVCVDETAAQVLRRVLEELSIRVESCPDFVRAAVRLAQDRFDVVIVDGESNQATIELLRETGSIVQGIRHQPFADLALCHAQCRMLQRL